MNCLVCGSQAHPHWKLKVLEKYDVQYYLCQNCGLIFTEKPYWLEEAYKKPINDSDTGLVKRNLMLSRKTSWILKYALSGRGPFLDYSGGYGLFVRLMRDKGFDFFWEDPYTKNLFAQGFERNKLSPHTKFQMTTAFEVIEHVENPEKLLRDLLGTSDHILMSTEVVPQGVTNDWHYLGTEHGQHIIFYTRKSLRILAEKLNLHLVSLGQLHFFSKSPKPLVKWVLVLTALRERLVS